MVNDDMETLLNILLELSSPHNVPDIFKQYDTTNLNISERIGNPKPYCEFNDRSLAHQVEIHAPGQKDLKILI